MRNKHKKSCVCKDHWRAFFTIWWFASGEKVMHTSGQHTLAYKLYHWFVDLEVNRHEQ